MKMNLENILDSAKKLGKKIGKKAVKAALPVIAAATFMMPREGKGILIQGHIIDAPAESVKVWRINPTDTIKTRTNVFGGYSIETNNFTPPASQGCTLYVEDKLKRVRTFMIRGPPEYTFLDLNLNKHTACIENVHDSTNFNSAPLNLIYWIDGFAPETTTVDTFSWYQGYDVHAGFDKSQAVHGAQAHFKFEKARAETLFFRNFHFTIDTTRFDAQLAKDTLYFTKDSMIIGIQEQEQKNIESKFQVMPTITNGEVKIYGINSFSIYNSAGQKIDEEKNSGNYFINGPSGVYFLKPKEPELSTKKIIKKN